MAEVILEEAPRKVRDLYQKGVAAMERGTLDYAMDMFMAALELEPRLLRARKFLRAAAVRKFKENKGGAITHILSSITGFPGWAMGMLAVKKKPMKALAQAEQLLRRDPLNLMFVQLLGQAAAGADMPEVTIQTLEVVREHSPKNTQVLEWLGKLYLEVNQTREGRACYEELARLKPNDMKIVKALKDAAALDTMQKGWDTAESYRDVIRDTKEAVVLEQEAKAVKTGEDVEALLNETRAKVEREPENINYRRSLADLLVRAQQYDEALKTLQEAVQIAGGDPQVEQSISQVRVRQWNHEIEQLRAAGDEQAAQQKAAERDAFIFDDTRDRVKRYPNDLQFRYQLGMLLFQRGEWNEAIQQFQLSQRNPQRRPSSLLHLARCFEKKGQLDIAMEQLEKAAAEMTAMNDAKKEVLYHMGTVAAQLNQPDKALAYFKEIYAVDIGYKDVADKMDRAYKQE